MRHGFLQHLRSPSHAHGGFDQWSSSYDDSRLQGVFFDRMHGELVRVLRPLLRDTASPRVLDVGCGTGRLLVRLRRELPAAELVGVDVSAGMLAVARAKPELAGVQLEEASAASLPFDDAWCDAAVSTVSFHHWEDQTGGLRGVARGLRPGAPLLMVDIFAAGLLGPRVQRFGGSHGAGFRRDGEVAAMLARAGMDAVELRRVGPVGSPLGVFVARRRVGASSP